MTWHSEGPKLNAAMIACFEEWWGRKLPESAVWFWTTVRNGGYPDHELEIPLQERQEERMTDVAGLYGLGHMFLDLSQRLDETDRARRVLPLGYDGMGGEIFLLLEGPFEGQVHWLPYELFFDLNHRKTYRLARDMRQFASLLERPQGSFLKRIFSRKP